MYFLYALSFVKLSKSSSMYLERVSSLRSASSSAELLGILFSVVGVFFVFGLEGSIELVGKVKLILFQGRRWFGEEFGE